MISLTMLLLRNARIVSSTSSGLSSTRSISFMVASRWSLVVGGEETVVGRAFQARLAALKGPPHEYASSSSVEREVEARAAIDPALRPDAAAVAMDDALHRGQSDPRARKL